MTSRPPFATGRPGTPDPLRFRILGPLEVDAGDGPIPLGGPKQRAVLAHLLIRANELVPADTLVDEIWGDDPPPQARGTLQSYVSHLRKAIGPDRILSQTPGYRLWLDPSELDATRFDILLRDARRALPRDPSVAASQLDEALLLWRGSALSDVADERSLLAEAARLDELKLIAIEERFDALLAIGEHARVIGELETLLTRHQLRERIWAQLILALYREGRQADALNAFQRAREILADELGIDPSPELARLHERVLKQDPSLELRGEPLRGYRLLEKIGEGPIGVVFRAIQPQVGRDVVVKIIHENVTGDPAFVRRFHPQAQAVAGLEHPHIVPIYDYWREPSGAYVVSRFLRGGTLRSVAERDDGIDPERGTRILEQIASALAYAHRESIIHGSVKASNVLLDADGNAYLGDFRIGVGPTATEADDIRGLASIARTLPLASRPAALLDLIDEAESGAGGASAQAFLDGLLAPAEPGTSRSAPAPEVRNPYKGLRPFTEADARNFFGRKALTARLVARLAGGATGTRFLAVVGPSGCGKSSVVRAGLVPAARAGALGDDRDICVAEMQPGSHPIEELEGALSKVAVGSGVGIRDRLESGSRGLIDAVGAVLPPDVDLLLVVDQFEELFTLGRVERERELFLEQLRVAAVDPESRVRVVVTLRADFYDRPLIYPRFGELLADGTEAVPALTPDEMEEAIRGPAEEAGVHADAGLVAQMIADVNDRPGALPLIQYALTELFDRRDGDRMTPDAYRRIGGIAGALSSRADRIFDSSDAEGRRAIRQVFLHLVTLGEGRPDTRRRVTRSQLIALEMDPEAVENVLDEYGHHRLLSFDREPSTREPTVEIAHEALLTSWTRLAQWIETMRSDLRQERSLARAASEWRGSDRDPSFLLREGRLQQTEAWSASTDLAIGVSEREYLKASLDAREAQEAVERQRADREVHLERRSRFRLRVLVAVLAVAALVASTLTVVAIGERRQAAQQSRIAFARELAAASVASLDVDAERSILLALRAIEVTRADDEAVLPEAEEALHRAVSASRIVLSVGGVGGSLDWSPDGVLFATEGPDESGLIDIRDAETGESMHSFPGHDPDVNHVAFSADGTMLASTGDDGDVRVWDPYTGEELRSFEGPDGIVRGPSFSPDGAMLAATLEDEGFTRIWSLESGRVVRTISLPDARVGNDTEFSPDGRRLAISTWEPGYAAIIDVRSGNVVGTLEHGDGVMDVDWSPDGRSISTAGVDGTVAIWDARSLALRYRIFAHRGWIWSSDWSPDSSRLATTSGDGTVKVWDLLPDGAQEWISLPDQEESGFLGVSFSPDGDRLMAGDLRVSSTKVWDVSPAGDAETTNLPSAWGGGVAFSADGQSVFTSNGDGSVAEWDASTGEGTRTLGRAGTPVGPPPQDRWTETFPSIDVSGDGTLIAAQSSTRARAWDVATGRPLFAPIWSDGWSFADLAWDRAGTLLAMADGGITRIVDRTGEPVAKFPEERGFVVNAVELSPDGALLATARESVRRPNPSTTRVTIWDVDTEESVTTMNVWAKDIAFDPTGRRIGTASFYGPGEVWDVATGERLVRLTGHAADVRSIAFSPDGSRVATAAGDATIRLWDAGSGTQLLRLPGHDVWELEFSPDGSRLATASMEGGVRIWALDLDELIEIARDELTRGFTDAECSQYLHQETCADPALPA